MRRTLSTLILSLLVASAALAVDVTKPENFLPGDLLMSADAQLSGKLKKIAEPFLKAQLESDKANHADNPEGDLLLTQILAGERVTLGYYDPQNLLAVFKVSDSQWEEFTAGTGRMSKEMYEGTEIFSKVPERIDDFSEVLEIGKESYVRIGEYAVFATARDGAKKIIDVARGASLSSLALNPDFQAIDATLLSPRIAGMNIDLAGTLRLAGGLFGQSAQGENKDELIEAILKRMGASFNETASGYGFSISLLGDGAKLKEKNLSLVPSGAFTPTLYKKFPDAAPIFYSESFNLKANQEQSNSISKSLFGESFKKVQSTYDEVLKEAVGLTQNEIYAPFTREFALAVQNVPTLKLPTATIIANVTDTREQAQKMADTLVEKFAAFLEKETPKGSYEVSREGSLNKITLYLTKLDDEYKGPDFEPIQITAGVTSDDLFVISTHPDIEKAATRTGLQQNADFKSHPELTASHAGVLYFNPRNLWKWFDSMLEWAESFGDPEKAPPLDLYQDYYGMLKYLYPWKDLVITTDGAEDRLSMTGAIGIDGATHTPYEALLDSFKKRDRDNDGVSDYEERYVYSTPVDSADCDNDGIFDTEELKRGQDPCKDKGLFNDVEEEAYYTDEVALLYQRGAISGYDDGSFQPGRPVNRAEFVQMVIKSFDAQSEGILGEITLPDNSTRGATAGEFSDVAFDEWFAPAVYRASLLGFVSGSIDPATGERVFRPADSITRAEAVAILNKASKALGASTAQGNCEVTPFQDVGPNDWYCAAVGNAYEHGVTKGRTATSFDPFGVLNRAEAAVMIRRVLEQDIEVESQLPAPSLEKLAPKVVPDFF